MGLCFQRLKPKYDKSPSNYAFIFTLRRYIEDGGSPENFVTPFAGTITLYSSRHTHHATPSLRDLMASCAAVIIQNDTP